MYDLVRDLPVEIEGHRLHGHEMAFSPEFSRLTTEVELYGGGESGVGEDVTYTGLDHIAFQAEGAGLRWPARTRSARSRTTSARSTCSPRRPSTPTPAATGAGPWSPPRWTSPFARPGVAGRRAGARGPPAQLRGVDAAVGAGGRGAGDRGPPATAPRALSGHALQARPHQHLDPGAGGRAGGHGTGGHARPEGLLSRHAGGCGHRPGALPHGAWRRFPTPGSRTPT